MGRYPSLVVHFFQKIESKTKCVCGGGGGGKDKDNDKEALFNVAF